MYLVSITQAVAYFGATLRCLKRPLIFNRHTETFSDFVRVDLNR